MDKTKSKTPLIAPVAGGQITALWSTPFLKVTLPGADDANQMLRDVILSLDTEQPDVTTDYRDNDFFANPHPAVRWLVDCVRRSVADFLRATGAPGDLNATLQAWVNVNRQGDYHALHNHPHSYLSGTYYVSVPDQATGAQRRSDSTPGAISFYDPRPQANMTAIRGDTAIDPAHTVLPVSGDLMIWPAWLHHQVHPNAAVEPRVSVSFNVVIASGAVPLPDQ